MGGMESRLMTVYKVHKFSWMRLLNVASTLSSSKNKYVYMQTVIKERKKNMHRLLGFWKSIMFDRILKYRTEVKYSHGNR